MAGGEARARGPTARIEAIDRILTPTRLRVYPVVLLLLFALTWTITLVVGSGPPVPDLLARWTGGFLVGTGEVAHLYDPVTQSRVQEGVGATRLSWFVSPPFVALAFAPLAKLPYPWAAAVWVAITLAVLAVLGYAAHLLLRRWGLPLRARDLLVCAASLPVLELVGGGQDSGVVALALTCGLVLLGREGPGRQALGGVMLSLMLVKPQVAVLVPLWLVVTRRWRGLAGFVCGATLLGLSGLLVNGPAGWSAWLSAIFSPVFDGAVGLGQAGKSTTILGLVRALAGPSLSGPATVVAVLLGVGLVLGSVQAWRRLPEAESAAVLVLAALLVAPHAMIYDLVLALPAIAVLLARTGGARARGLLALAFVLLWVGPLLTGAVRDRPWPVSVVAAPWWVLPLLALWWQLSRARSAITAPTGAP